MFRSDRAGSRTGLRLMLRIRYDVAPETKDCRASSSGAPGVLPSSRAGSSAICGVAESHQKKRSRPFGWLLRFERRAPRLVPSARSERATQTDEVPATHRVVDRLVASHAEDAARRRLVGHIDHTAIELQLESLARQEVADVQVMNDLPVELARRDVLADVRSDRVALGRSCIAALPPEGEVADRVVRRGAIGVDRIAGFPALDVDFIRPILEDEFV